MQSETASEVPTVPERFALLHSDTTLSAVLALMAVSLFVPTGLANFIQILFLCYAIYYLVIHRYKIAVPYHLLLLLILFVMYVIAGLLDENASEAFKIVSRKTPVLIIALSFVALGDRLTQRHFHVALLGLIASCLIVSFYCYGQAAYNILSTGTLVYPDKVYELYYFAYTPLTQPFEPIYLGMFVNLAFMSALTNPLIKKPWLRSVISIYLGLFIILIASKVGIGIFLVLLSILTLRTRRSPLRFVLIGAVILFMGYAVYKFPFLKSRFLTSVQYDITEENGGVWTSTTLRLAIWSSAFDAIKGSPLYGYGPGDAQDVLEASYQNKGFVFGLYYQHHPGIPQFNPHSEFISVMLELGAVGLIVIIAMFLVGVRTALRDGDLIGLSFIIICLLTFLVESVLLRQKGLIFFTYFYCLTLGVHYGNLHARTSENVPV